MERAELKELVLATGRAEVIGEWVVLCDPSWGASERAQWAELRKKLAGMKPEGGLGWLGVPTGGTSGRLKFARHDEATLGAAVRGFCEHFDVGHVNAVDVLPGHHVSGLMARVRCAATGGQHVGWDWKQLEAGVFPEVGEGWFLSLVPTQLQRLMGRPEVVAWLKTFRAVLVGGGPLWKELAEEARVAGLPLTPCYGMSETAAMVAAVLPEEFLSGEASCGRAMPHAQIEIVDECVRVRGESVCQGYLGEPERETGAVWVTEDVGRLDDRGFLWIEGRRDAVIISGGKKISPEEVEAVLRATEIFDEIAVIGLPDAEWGQVVVACYWPEVSDVVLARAREAVERAVASYKRPRKWVLLAAWPRNDQAKTRRAELVERALKVLRGGADH